MTETNIATTIGRQIVLNPEKIEQLRNELHGAAVLPGEDGYDAARKIYNAMIDHRPAADPCCLTTSCSRSSNSYTGDTHCDQHVTGSRAAWARR